MPMNAFFLVVGLAVIAALLLLGDWYRLLKKSGNKYQATRDQQNDSERLTQIHQAHQATFRGPAAHGFKKDHAAVILPIANRRTKP